MSADPNVGPDIEDDPESDTEIESDVDTDIGTADTMRKRTNESRIVRSVSV